MEEVEPFELGSFPIAVYGAMFAATLVGQISGVAIDLALHLRSIAVPLVCGTLLDAFVGYRFATSQVHRSLSATDWGRLSAYYSAALAALSVPLALWTAASQLPRAPSGTVGQHNPAVVLVVGGVALVVVTVARWGIMAGLGRRRL